MKHPNQKIKHFNRILNLGLFLGIIGILYSILSTYAFFTSQVEEEKKLQLGDMNAEILVNNSQNLTFSLNDLMYLNDSENDFNLLADYSSIVTLKITNTSVLPQKVRIKFSVPVEGLFYLITPMNENNYAALIQNSPGSNTREKIQAYNHTFQKTLFDDTILNINQSLEFKILFFAIYDYLSETNKPKYDTIIFKGNMLVECIQYHTDGEYSYD